MHPANHGAPMARDRRLLSRFATRIARNALLLCVIGPLVGAVSNPPSSEHVSDQVGATAGKFSVNESGAATYSLPIYTTPGTAGFAPALSLEYNSQGGDGPMGKGWSLAGTSSISRCRAARETADFSGDNQALGAGPDPLTMTGSDKLCLDGQRLLAAVVPAGTPGCKALAGATATEYRTEIESFQRVCAYRFSDASGPRFFTVERKDGTTGWYGDRRDTAGTETSSGTSEALRVDSVANWDLPAGGSSGIYFTWAQTRNMDASGNYIDYQFYNDHGEIYPEAVYYTGKKVLAGQAGTALPPYASVVIGYTGMPDSYRSTTYVKGMAVTRALAASWIKVTDSGSGTPREARYYVLNYNGAGYGGPTLNLLSVQECADSTRLTCYPATQFKWSDRNYRLGEPEEMSRTSFGKLDDFDGYKLGDIDGDGLQDMVWLKDQVCGTEEINIAFGQFNDATGVVDFMDPPQTRLCTPREEVGSLGKGESWFLLDYDGDGKDDLFLAANGNDGYMLWKSKGRPTSQAMSTFDATANLVYNLLPSPADKETLAQLADLNGDGLLDVFYKRAGVLKARLMERTGATYAWGTERALALKDPVYCPTGAAWSCSLVTPDIVKTNGGIHLYDFDGDARSELMFRDKEVCGNCHDSNTLVAYRVISIDATTITLDDIAYFDEGPTSWDNYENHPGTDYRFGDFNGDGLTDVVYRMDAYRDTQWNTDHGDWVYRLNTGRGFTSPIAFASYRPRPEDYRAPADSLTAERLQVTDVNGDGFADIAFSNNVGMYVYYGKGTGGFQFSWIWSTPALMDCGELNCDLRFTPVFSDFDGDGGLDLLRLKWKDSDGGDDFKMVLFRSDAPKRYVPSNTIVAVTDGLGARTDVTYLPMSLKDIYRRDQGSRNLINVGRGSPVQDVLAPMYVVATVRTDAPTGTDPNAQHAVHYRYSGAKMQAGGRGFLGFEQVTSIDTAVASAPVATTTTFRQDFPYIGRPLSTDVTVLPGAYAPPACATAASDFDSTCFSNATGDFPALAGTRISRTVYSWDSPDYPAAAQAPIRVELTGTETQSFDLETGARLSRVSTGVEYDAWSNPTVTTVGTYPGAESPGPADPKPRIKTTTSTYENNQSTWRLGRMLTSQVDQARDGVTVTRTMAFAYDPVTGLLTREHLQPGGPATQDLRTEYTLDAFGNRTGTYTCSKDIATCAGTAPVVSVWSMNTIHRYSKSTYDSRGRFLVSTSEPFVDPASTTWGTGERKDAITQKVVARDRFGNVTEVNGLNGAMSAATFGAMGRPYWTWTKTVTGANADGTPSFALDKGVDSKHLYGSCSGPDSVSCPAGASFREKLTTEGAPTRWTYFDRLGRSVLAVQQTLNQGVMDQDLSGVCSWYDGSGRVAAVSNAFFLPGAFGDGDPTFATAPCVVDALERTVGVTHSFHDVLGRPTVTSTVGRNASDGTLVYENDVLIDYQGLATVTTNDLGQSRTEVRNPVGELVSSTDNLGTATRYEYDPTGNLTRVRRNAGAGRADVVTTMLYDALGRKTTLIDPDAGVHGYTYNPAGEVTGENTGGVSYLAKRYDFKGRLIWESESRLSDNATERTTIRTYDTADSGNGLGQLASMAATGRYLGYSPMAPNFQVDHAVGYSYDALGRRVASATKIPIQQAAPFAEAIQYDALGRPFKQLDASTRWAKTDFSSRGFPLRVCLSTQADVAPGCVSLNGNTYRETLATDARGNPVSERLGGTEGMRTTRRFHPFSGALVELCTGTGTGSTTNGCQIVDEKYAWDNAGNLLSRDKNFQGQARGYLEEFTYDGLNRLSESRFARIGERGAGVAYAGALRPFGAKLTYDRLGDICSRLTPSTGTPVTRTYAYNGAGGCGLDGLPGASGTSTTMSPHAVASVSVNGVVETQYGYDSTGNQLSANRVADDTSDRTIKYTLQGDAYNILRGSRETRFWYDGDGGRYMRDDVTYSLTGGATFTRTVTIGNVEFVSGDAGGYVRRNVAGVMYQQIATTSYNRYLHQDHLGNVVAVTAGTGAVVERLDYSPSGERRSTTDPRLAGTPSAQTKRGFTGHETVDFTDVIHMNGRIYDPALGRFLQVDPVIQDLGIGQNFNRYTYVWNNPLAYTDPTGMISVKQLIRSIAGIYLGAYIGNRGIPGLQPGGTASRSVGAFFGGYASSGNLKTALAGAFVIGSVSHCNESPAHALSYRADPMDVSVGPFAENSSAEPVDAPWMSLAEKERGQAEVPGEGDNPRIVEYHSATSAALKHDSPGKYAWCSAFVNFNLRALGIERTNAVNALSWASYGVKLDPHRPAFGAIAVWDNGRGHGHVAFVAGRTADGHIVYLGGNQSDMVNYSTVSDRLPTYLRFPSGYSPNYVLPVVPASAVYQKGSTQ